MTSPAPIKRCYDLIKTEYKDAELGGIYANKPGYHNAPNNLPASDYSLQRDDDKGYNKSLASALDITLRDEDDIRKITDRCRDLTNAGDDRFQCVREFIGTLDGNNVFGMDVRKKQVGTYTDDTHLWHLHLSFYRRYCNSYDYMENVAYAILNNDGDDVSAKDVWNYKIESSTGNEMTAEARLLDIEVDVTNLNTKINALQSDIDKILDHFGLPR